MAQECRRRDRKRRAVDLRTRLAGEKRRRASFARSLPRCRAGNLPILQHSTKPFGVRIFMQPDVFPEKRAAPARPVPAAEAHAGWRRARALETRWIQRK